MSGAKITLPEAFDTNALVATLGISATLETVGFSAVLLHGSTLGQTGKVTVVNRYGLARRLEGSGFVLRCALAVVFVALGYGDLAQRVS